MKPYRSYKILAWATNTALILGVATFMTMRNYYQYKIVKRVVPEITFWEWYWGFAK